MNTSQKHSEILINMLEFIYDQTPSYDPSRYG